MKQSAIPILVVALGISGCAAPTAAVTQGQFGQTAATMAAPTPPDTTLILLQRALDSRGPATEYSQALPQKPEIVVGALPPVMPFQLPIPSNAVVLGSVAGINSIKGETAIYMDAGQSAEEAVKFYQSRLLDEGFATWERGAPAAFPSAVSAGFCQKDKGIQLEVSAYGAPGQPTDLRVLFDTDPAYVSCNAAIPSMTEYSAGILPSLPLPNGVTLLGSGSGGGFEGWAYSEQSISTESTPGELATIMSPKVTAAGWKLLDDYASAVVAWSRWSRTDDKGLVWSGVLTITAGAGSQNVKVLKFQIEKMQ